MQLIVVLSALVIGKCLRIRVDFDVAKCLKAIANIIRAVKGR